MGHTGGRKLKCYTTVVAEGHNWVGDATVVAEGYNGVGDATVVARGWATLVAGTKLLMPQ